MQKVEKMGTSKHILNANKLGLLRTKGKYPPNSLYSLLSVLHALHTIFCCYRTETEENHGPRGGTVPGERLQEDLEKQWRDERGVGELLSRALGKQQLVRIELSFSSSFSRLKTSWVGNSHTARPWAGGYVVVFADQYLNIAKGIILYFYSTSSYQWEMCVRPNSLKILLFWLFNAQNCWQELGFVSPFIITGLLRNTRLLAALCFVVTRRESTTSFILGEQNTVTETVFFWPQ